jgi:hypothetical protein
MKLTTNYLLVIILFFIICSEITAQEGDIWDSVKETTWRYKDNWTGGVFTFYETNSGDKMAIWQMCGSGVMVTGSFLFRIQIEDNMLLFYHYSSIVKQQNAAYVYFLDEDSGMLFPKVGFNVLYFFSEKPWVANKFKTIPIEEIKREDYSQLDLLN